MLRRLTLAAALATVVAAAVPSFAAAEPTCGFNPANHTVTVFDDDARDAVVIKRTGVTFDVHTNANPFGRTCMTAAGEFATINNTDQIVVKAISHGGVGPRDGVIVDETNGAFEPGFTAENDGHNEIEVAVQNVTPLAGSLFLEFIGTPDNDIIRVGDQGVVNAGLDFDPELYMVNGPPSSVTISGGLRNDWISGQGDGLHAPSSVSVTLNGGPGEDTLTGSPNGDFLNGDAGPDHLYSADRGLDFLTGGPDHDDAFVDTADSLLDVIESVAKQPVGTLRLTPRTQRLRPGATGRLTMSWTHPKAWRALRKLDVQLYDGASRVGTIALDPRTGGMSARGGVELAHGSRLTHHGRTVTAKLRLRLRGARALRVAVQATDRRGRTQLESDAGSVFVS